MTIYLYAKQHNKTGLRYFGKTTRDPYKYNGSGKYWTNHCNKHGWDITTTWVYAYEDIKLCEEEALFFSEVYDIVESSDWANLKPENGINGGTVKGHKKSQSARLKMSIAKKGKPTGRNTNYRNGRKDTPETIAKRSASLTGRKPGPQTEKRKANTARIMKLWWVKRKEQKDLENA